MAAFGTSGVRGLQEDFTRELCAAYVTAFLERCADIASSRRVYVAADFRFSSPRIAAHTLGAIQAAGWEPVWAGRTPTPALAAYAIDEGAPAVMITGSHIPEQFNGIKFYRPDGEFLKEDEAPVRKRAEELLAQGIPTTDIEPVSAFEPVSRAYIDRALAAFGPIALKGARVGIDQHSAVGRDLLVEIFKGLGAEVFPFRRVEGFVAVDTEALDPEDVVRARDVIAQHQLDAVISTDGDGDRPLVIDNLGRQINGDVLGALTARFLGARAVITPLSSTSAIEESGWFDTIERTRIGSPYVVAGMNAADVHPVVGFEANGGFLLGDDIALATGPLKRLPTRDSALPAIATLVAARQAGLALSDFAATLPPRFMKADRVKNVTAEKAVPFLKSIETSREFRVGFDVRIADPVSVSTLDGVRMAFANGDTVHFRQSGNAPEMRIYVETGALETTDRLLHELIETLKAKI